MMVEKIAANVIVQDPFRIVHQGKAHTAGDAMRVRVQVSADTYFGGSTVTTSGATAGIKVSTGSTLLIPTTGAGNQTLYAITASTSNVTFVHP